jgi:predicted ArsR family transcriptional regulator
MPDEGNRLERRVVVRDVRALSTLAHPLRLRLLNYLLRFGPRTARQCADALGDTGANCSYHLRHLARYGLVERAQQPEGADGRERPWQAAATGFDFAGDPADPANDIARSALASLELDELMHMLHRYLDRQAELDQQWREAATFHTYGLTATPEELTDLVGKLDATIRPFIAATRTQVPEGARPVHLSLQAVLRPDAI